ncbi:hypothetical protein MUK70_03805 [Dyadobacter chenwenxiniae]|uniref:Uncharacterized protein n=1 Tax=Dyadobacter chenwenxiniae TaxID=2906456 RepID=A0A9X1PTD2_9BACT|nr:hypothetical protein [Dyadobacter chenwenxiniae]MCF0065744.1 hypothetical protein [Dyadobacter chenwenxiniae]UON84116.1 hypothetical protein MUK70_03805 [Dyadobacter chenwenxiniae]
MGFLVIRSFLTPMLAICLIHLTSFLAETSASGFGFHAWRGHFFGLGTPVVWVHLFSQGNFIFESLNGNPDIDGRFAILGRFGFKEPE